MSARTFSMLFVCSAAFSPALLAQIASSAQQTPESKGAQTVRSPAAPEHQEKSRSTYVLGPDDVIGIRVLEAEEISNQPMRVDPEGDIRLPYAGRIHAAGLTVEQLQTEVTTRLRAFIREPDATVSVIESRSQPVSVLGAVRSPGVHQLQGRKTLAEMLSLAGGLDAAAGGTVKITRRLEWGRIPLRNAWDDPTGEFSVAQVSVKAIEGQSPDQNILICPQDVISVPRAEMVYVAGQVVRAGGFLLNDRESMSVLEAVTLAGGTDRFAAPQHSRLLRRSSAGQSRTEIPIDVRKILAGKAEDVRLHPEDILYIPDNTSKRAATRAMEAAIQAATGIVIWRR